MKTILCPVDFSISSDRVSRYAAQLARDTKSKVILIATHEGKIAVPAGGGAEDKGDAIEMLGEMHDLLKGDYTISCGVEEEILSGNIAKKLSSKTDRYDLTILGAPQDKKEFQNFAGVDLIKVIQNSLAPLLIVPENFNYEKIKRLTYAYDYSHESQPPLAQLYWLANWFGAEVQFVSILPNSSTSEELKLNSIQNKVANEWKSGIKISFDSIAYKNVAECLDHYIGLWSENNLLVLSVNHQNILERLWHKSVVKELLLNAKRPYIILHK
ncbi:MAG: universal stress protein [Bacteroidetes bacterium]|nr:universal stress protein [Bacteroidota bacterium]